MSVDTEAILLGRGVPIPHVPHLKDDKFIFHSLTSNPMYVIYDKNNYIMVIDFRV